MTVATPLAVSGATLGAPPGGPVSDRNLGVEGGGEVVEVVVGDRAATSGDLGGEHVQVGDPAGSVVRDCGDVPVEDLDGGAAGSCGAGLFPGAVSAGG
jgi:hypothetical protein